MKLPYLALGFLIGFFPGRFKWHALYLALIVAAFLLGRYFPTITISWR